MVIVAAGVGILALGGSWVLTGDRGKSQGTEQAAAEGIPSGRGDGVFGVRGASVDSARQIGRRPAQALTEAGGRQGPGDAAQNIFPSDEPGGPVAPPPPPEAPAPLSADVLAESDEIQAAQPGVKAALEAGLASRRAALRTQCWKGEDLPDSARFMYEVTYSAEGSMLSMSQGDEGAPGAVAECVRNANPVPPTVEAPGIPVTVQAALTLP